MAADRTTAEERLIAIVDDDASVRRSMRRLIRSFGFGAEAFASAEEFLASERGPATDCLILDVRMPGMDGLELQRRLADVPGAPIPIVFLTAQASDEEEQRARRRGAIEFLRKPVGRDTLLRVLRGIFEEKE